MTFRVLVASTREGIDEQVSRQLRTPALEVMVDASGDLISKYDHMYRDDPLIRGTREFYVPCDVQVYAHDDLTIHEPWRDRVQAEFDADPSVAIVGLGGAIGIGVDDIYKRPYSIEQLQRIEYRSNQTDAEVHGERFDGAMDVAVVDGFFMAIRTEFLKRIGGWEWMHRFTNFHLYDVALCCEAIRRGWKVRMVGVSVTHEGGRTSTSTSYADWCRDRGTTMEDEHARPHRLFYEEYRDLLPYRVGDKVCD